SAVERYRHRLRELSADLHRTRSSPWPSGVAKAAARVQINALADAAAPDVDRCIEHGLPISFATTALTAMVRGTDKPGIASTETVDVLGLLYWVMRDQIIAKIEREIDAAADDKAALSPEDRERLEAQIMADTLIIERAECSVIWHAEARGDVIDFRRDTSL